MPKKLERSLSAYAHRLGITKSNPRTRRRYGAIVYGGMRRIAGWEPKLKRGRRHGRKKS